MASPAPLFPRGEKSAREKGERRPSLPACLPELPYLQWHSLPTSTLSTLAYGEEGCCWRRPFGFN